MYSITKNCIAEADLGYTIEEFGHRFLQICQEHKSQGTAKAFAVILYEYQNKEFRNELNNHNYFTRLDRLTGKDLSVFYLKDGDKKDFKDFNSLVNRALDLKELKGNIRIVFFKFNQRRTKNAYALDIQLSDEIRNTKYISTLIEDYISELNMDDTFFMYHLLNSENWISAFHTVAIEKVMEKIYSLLTGN